MFESEGSGSVKPDSQPPILRSHLYSPNSFEVVLGPRMFGPSCILL